MALNLKVMLRSDLIFNYFTIRKHNQGASHSKINLEYLLY